MRFIELVLWLVLISVVVIGCSEGGLKVVEENRTVDRNILLPDKLPTDYLIEDKPAVVKEEVKNDVSEPKPEEPNKEYDYSQFERQSRPRLIVHVIDIDSGYSIFVRTPEEKTILINTGGEKSGGKVARAVLGYGYDKLDAVVLSNYNVENVGGYVTLIDEIGVDRTFYNGYYTNSKYFDKFVEAAKAHSLNEVKKDMSFDIDKYVDIEFIVPYDTVPLVRDKTDSILVRITYENFSMLLTGNCLAACEEVFVSENADVSAKILRSVRGGSKYGNTEEFIDLVSPEVVVLERGGSADIEFLGRLRDKGVKVYDTAKKRGDIIISSDGLETKFEFPDDK